MDERGWASTDAHLLEIRFLDWLVEVESPQSIPPAISFYGDDHETVTSEQSAALIVVLKDLESRGLIGGQKMKAGWIAFHAKLTPEGRRQVTERQARRTSRRARSVPARDAMLDWMYENTSDVSREAPEIRDFAGTAHAHFEGNPFTESEITTAAEHLSEEGYVTGIKAWGAPLLRPKVTAKGRRAVESGRYTAHPEVASSTINSLTIGGDNWGQAGAGNVSQEQTTGVDPGKFSMLVGDLRGALTELSEADRARAEVYVEMIEGEATSNRPDSGVLAVAGRGLKSIGDRFADKAVGAGVDALWAYVVSRLGLSDQSGRS